MGTALLILALLLVLMALAPVGPAPAKRVGGGGLRRRIERQLRLWDNYLDQLQRW
jgi:hypothetical protein